MADLRDLLAAALDAADRELGGVAPVGWVLGDIPIAVRLDTRGRIPALAAMIGVASSAPATDAWTIDVIGGGLDGHAGLLPPPAQRGMTVLRANDDIYYLWLDEVGGYLTAIDRRRRRAMVWFTQPDRIASWHVARPLIHAIKGISFATPWTPIHAAAASWQGRAVVAIGQSGAGKTSIALASAMTGWNYLGDDAVLVRAGPPAVARLFSSARVRPDMFEILAGAMAASLGTSDDAGELKAELDMRRIGACREDSAPIAAITLPERRGAPRPELLPVSRSETVRRIVLAARQSIQGDDSATFDKIAALVRDVPCYRFDPGPDPFAAAEALAKLVTTGETA